MSDILNITNGDCAIDIMQQAGMRGEFIAWRDVLHDGPVPKGLALEQLSDLRSQFISERGWGKADDIRQSFRQRDITLKSSGKYAKVLLWFEHDLYDQLQLIQLLDWFNLNRPEQSSLSLICVDQYLGTLTPREMTDLVKLKQPVTESQLKLASLAWSAFRSETPEQWFELLHQDTTALPFLEGCITRLLEEFPDCTNGLSRTAFQTLHIISQQPDHPWEIFSYYQQSEERRFLGDSSFWSLLNNMLTSSPSLITLADGERLTLPFHAEQKISLTRTGSEVLNANKSWLEITDLDQWIGGVHLTADNCWCWDADSRSLLKKPA